MQPTTLVQTLVECWDDLPRLVGASWAQLFPDVVRRAAELRQISDPDRQATLVMELALLFKDHPQVAERLREALQNSQRKSPDEGNQPPAIPNWPSALDGLSERLNSPIVTRYTDISAPRRLAPGRRGGIIVRLTCAPLTASDVTRTVSARLAQTVEIYLHARSGDFEVDGEPVRRLRVEPDRDSDTVVFVLTALRAGHTTVRLDFRQAGLTIATVELAIDVSAESASDEHTRTEAPVAIGGTYAPPPDLDLRVTVTMRDGRSVLGYVVHSPNGAAGYHYYPAGGVTILGSPEQYQARLMTRIEGLTGSQAQTGLRALGEQLYRELFPSELRRAYQQLTGLPIRSLQITSDEPWIPWELVHPYDDDDPDHIVDDDFLCARFELTRWLAGRSGPAGTIHIHSLACLNAGQPPTQPPLPSVAQERIYLTGLADRHGLQDHSPRYGTAHAVSALLDGQHGPIDLWHFAGHGDVSLIVLADGSCLRPEDLFGPRQTAIARTRPLVFLNACRVSQQSWSLTQLGGWAAAWAGRCRCGVFAGPLWSVTDEPAWIFAHTFYEQIAAGHTLGQAVQAARAQTRQHAPDDTTWLAYSVYAHPNARVVFTP